LFYEVELWSGMKIKPTQWYAYDKYLACLARKLAAMDIEGVAAVFYWIQLFGPQNHFDTSAELHRQRSRLVISQETLEEKLQELKA
jgi:hypothetical protein